VPSHSLEGMTSTQPGVPDEATQRWLQPLLEEAARQKIPGNKIALIMAKGGMSTAEPDGRSVQAVDSPNPDIDVMDFLRVGELLRKEVGWEDSYPARPEHCS
jgi:hypothetical protein